MRKLFVSGCGHDGRLGTGNEKNLHKFTELRLASPPDHQSSEGGETTQQRKEDASLIVSLGSKLETSTTAAPAKSDVVVEVRAAVVGGFHNFIVTEPEGRVFAFGLNEFGQLGLGTKAPNVKTPQAVPFFEERWKRRRQQKQEGESCQGGDGKTADQIKREKKKDSSGGKGDWLSPECGLIDLRCGAYHTVALCDDGIYVCGANDHGQLGLGHFDPVFSAVGFINITPNVKPSASSSSASAKVPNFSPSHSIEICTNTEKTIGGEEKNEEGTRKTQRVEGDATVEHNCEDEVDEWTALQNQTREKEGRAEGKGAVAAKTIATMTSVSSSSSSSSSSLASRLTTVDQVIAVRCGSYHTIVLVQDVPRTPDEEEASRARLLAAFAKLHKNGVCDSVGTSSNVGACDGVVDHGKKTGASVEICGNRSSRPQRREREERTVSGNFSSSAVSGKGVEGEEQQDCGHRSQEQEELGKLIDQALQIAKREEQLRKEGEGQEGLLLRYFLNDNGNAAATIPGDSSPFSSSAVESLSHRYSVFTCGKGDFGELGYDADEWDKLTAIDKRVKQNVANKAAYVANGGKEEDYLAATAGQTGGFGIGMGGGAGGKLCSSPYSASSSAARASPFAKFKTTATNTPPPKPVRRPEFSSHTFRRVAFPLLDYGFYAHKPPTQQQELSPTCTKVRISGVKVEGHHHHTSVVVEYPKIPAKTCSSSITMSTRSGAEVEDMAVFHFGCRFANAVETIETSVPREVTITDFYDKQKWNRNGTSDGEGREEGFDGARFIHVGDEGLFGVFPPSSSSSSSTATACTTTTTTGIDARVGEAALLVGNSDVIFVVGKGNLGQGDKEGDDDFAEEGHGKRLALLPPQPITVAVAGKPLSGPLLREGNEDDACNDSSLRSLNFTHYLVHSITGKSHFFITARWFGKWTRREEAKEEDFYCDVIYVFGDNFMGQCGVGFSEENAILKPTIVKVGPIVMQRGDYETEAGHVINPPRCGFRHSLFVF